MRGYLLLAAIAMLIFSGAIGATVMSCYPRPPVNPPSCAQDPTQDWCVPPSFARAHDGGGPGCRRIAWRPGTVAMACDDLQPTKGDVDLIVDATGRTWDACAWNRCGQYPDCRTQMFGHDGSAR